MLNDLSVSVLSIYVQDTIVEMGCPSIIHGRTTLGW